MGIYANHRMPLQNTKYNCHKLLNKQNHMKTINISDTSPYTILSGQNK